MRMRIRKKSRTPAARGGQAHIPDPGGAPTPKAANSYPGGAPNAGSDGLPGSAGYRGGPKDKPPGGFVFYPPQPEPPNRPKKPWE